MNQIERKKMIKELRVQKKEIKKQLQEIERLQISLFGTPHSLKEFKKYEARKYRLKSMMRNLDEQIKALKTDNLLAPVGKGKVRLRTGKTDP